MYKIQVEKPLTTSLARYDVTEEIVHEEEVSTWDACMRRLEALSAEYPDCYVNWYRI